MIKIDDLDKIIPKQAKNMGKIDTKVKKWYGLGVYSLNYAVSKNLRFGIPSGRVSAIEGLSGTGKSLLAAAAMKDPDLDLIIVIDTEGGGASAELYEFAGVDLNKVRMLKAHTFCNYRINKKTGKKEEVSSKDVPANIDTDTYVYVEGATRLVSKIIDSLTINKKLKDAKILILLDSLANLQSFREVQGVYDMGARAQEVSRFFRAFDNAFEESEIAFIFTNKVYTNIGNEYVPFVSAGGTNVTYNPSVTITLSESAQTEDMNDADKKAERDRRKSALGSSVKTMKAVISKSRFGTEKRTSYFILDMHYGPSKFSGLFKLLKDFDVIKTAPGRGRYLIEEMWEGKSFLKKDFIEKIAENENENINKLQELLEKAEERIKNERLAALGKGEDIPSLEEIEDEMLEDDILNMDADDIANSVAHDIEK